MKALSLVLLALFLVLQYKLWLDDGGVTELFRRKKAIAKQQEVNIAAKTRNQALVAQINDLQSGYQQLEAHARHDLDMIKKGEAFYRVIPSTKQENAENEG